jgi:D-alanyl-D-alanine dipeptidase
MLPTKILPAKGSTQKIPNLHISSRKQLNHSKNIAKELEAKNLGLLIWDAYRPYRTTVKFWKMKHDERYVANPAKGSGHNRGIAVDLTLYEISTGELLEMPTGRADQSDSEVYNLCRRIFWI